MSGDVVKELRSWCAEVGINQHDPDECLFCMAAETIERHHEELYNLARLSTGGRLGAVTGPERDVQLYVGRLAHRYRHDPIGRRLASLVTWPMVVLR